MFKKILASIGIGNAEVDTQLEKDRYMPGEEVKGKVLIKGGNTEQNIDRIQLFIMTEAVRETDDSKVYESVMIKQYTIGEAFKIGAGEERVYDFSFNLPAHTPPTLGKTKIWVQTGLDVPNAVDPNDQDFIQVDPHPYMETVLTAVTDVLGFHLRKVEMEYSKRYNYVQEFEFTPMKDFRGDLDELEILFFMKDNGLDLVMQVDRRAKGLGGLFAEALEMDESFVKIQFSQTELNQGKHAVAEKLKNIITQYV
ncbi:MAG: sporulation protein [Bacillaceae bacterium]|nr:sporulation protein [Bacillaceae bacterium]